MSKNEMSRDEAAEIFVRLLTTSGYTGSYRDFMEGVRTGTPKRSFASMASWYHLLEAPDREQIDHIVKQAMNFAIFNILCLLDGVSGFTRIENRPVHFLISLEAYDDIGKLLEGKPAIHVPINPPSEGSTALHDLFKEMADIA